PRQQSRIRRHRQDSASSGAAHRSGIRMNVGLRSHHSATLRVAMAEGLPEEMRHLTREIIDVQSTNQRKGHANGLMAEVCHEADKWWMTLIITVRPFGAACMDDAKLERFYRKFGFRRIQSSPLLMARSPELPRIQAVH